MPGLVLYFRVDGRFSLWDPAQHYWRRNRAKNVDHESRPDPFVKRGDAVNWLVSDVFGLPQARSVPAEQAIQAAERFMRGQADDNPEGLRTSEEIHRRLLELLGDRDPFWPRWLVRTGVV